VTMPGTSKIVVGIAGHMGSGKTSVAHLFESELGFQYLRYSQVLAEWFETDPTDKDRLQSVGSEVMAGEGQIELNRRLIARIDRSKDVVIDGLRHPTDYESLYGEFNGHFFLVFVDAPPDVRFQRLAGRFSSYERFLQSDTRAVESHIDSLRPLATVVVTGMNEADDNRNFITELVRDFRKKVVK